MTHEHAAIPQDLEPDVRAVIELWETLAAFAWDQQITFGRGVILIDQEELNAACEAKCAGEPYEPQLGYVPATDIPPGDDFRRVIASHDPQTQIAILIRPRGGDVNGEDDRLYIIEAAAHGRPSPKECYFRRSGKRHQ